MSESAKTTADATVPVVSVPEGDYIFRAGDPAHSFLIVSTGQVELLRRGETRGRLALLDPGDVVGDDSAFEGQVRAYDARALTPVTLLEVTTTTFTDLVRVRPELAGVLISRAAVKLLQARAACLAIAQPAARTQAVRFVHVESGSQFLLPSSDAVVIGRADPRTTFTPDVELSTVDTHRSLSRKHAVVTRTASGYVIVEQPRVANGTFVNGVRLAAGAATAINDGDEVSFGLIRTVFRTT
jgi:CRP-like cAMP-binding protein